MSAPERRPAAILYVELRNFTRLSETLEAPQVLQLANEFFSFTGKHIGERGGRAPARSCCRLRSCGRSAPRSRRWAPRNCRRSSSRAGRRSRSTASYSTPGWTLLNAQGFAHRLRERFGGMGARDAELAVEDEGRHRRNPEPAHLFFQCGDFLRISLQRPARNPAALRNLLQHFGIADVLGLFEVGAEKVLDHRLAGALALSELDQAVRSEGARRARHALERELDTLPASFRGEAGVELAAPLDRAEFRLAVLRARHPALRYLGGQLKGQVANAHLRFVTQKHERLFKAPLADVAPRANDIGNHLDAQRLSHYRFFAGIVQR